MIEINIPTEFISNNWGIILGIAYGILCPVVAILICRYNYKHSSDIDKDSKVEGYVVAVILSHFLAFLIVLGIAVAIMINSINYLITGKFEPPANNEYEERF